VAGKELTPKGITMNQRILRQCGDDGLRILTLAREDGKPNLIDEIFLEELEDALETIDKDREAKGLLIRSSHPSVFLAGADLSQLSRKSSRDLDRLLSRGQDAFAHLARLSIPTACAIDGACLGGGYEMALACDYRVVSDSSKAVIGLPETSLGLLPGWGGCYRLPRLVGLLGALTIVVSGKPFRPEKARKLGMVDEVVPNELIEPVAKEWLAKGKRSSGKFFFTNLWPVARFVSWRASREVLARTRDNYPAPLAAIKVLRKATFAHLDEAMSLERRAFAGLAKTAAARNLVSYFFLREQAKKVDFSFKSKRLPEIRRVHVIGAGVMGGGIAQWVASRGIDVVLSDLSPDALSDGLRTVDRLLGKARARGILSAVDARAAMDRITPVSEKVPLREGDLVIEAIVERIGAKRSLFADLEKRGGDDVPFASNTSALSIDSMSVAMTDRGRLGGLHFFNPVHRMELVEVIRGPHTDPAVVESLLGFVRRIGKRAILCKDSPGFLVNRILVPYLVEAAELWMEGWQADMIDKAMLEFGMPMGPMRLIDEIGLDVATHVANELKFRLSHLGSPPDLLDRMVDKGLLGRKSGTGFYFYKGKSSGKPDLNHGLTSLRNKTKKSSKKTPKRKDEIIDRMILVMVNEAARCLEEGVVDKPEDVDFGMIAGAGWAPFRGGPLRHADSQGLTQIVSRMERLSRKDGNRFRPCGLLLDLARHGECFYPNRRMVPKSPPATTERTKS
jgi:3-hydroxyacyl-CoA dehydrogenase/enoyl-CoA hydratase/3-hydroxybutyryl-CoA epimerase